MALIQSQIDLTSTATVLNPVTVTEHPVIEGQAVYSWNRVSLIVQNIDSAATVYLGDSSVSSTNYGVSIPAGGSVTLDDLRASCNEFIYGVSSGSTKVSVLYIQR